jgi:hypothetical protein
MSRAILFTTTGGSKGENIYFGKIIPFSTE